MGEHSLWIGAWPTPEDAAQLAGDGGYSADLHVTLGFFVTDWAARTYLLEAADPVSEWRKRLDWMPTLFPAKGIVSGRATFHNGDTDHSVLLVRSANLNAARALFDSSHYSFLDRTYDPWTPHITVTDHGQVRRHQPVCFDRVMLVHGYDRYNLAES